MLEHRKIRASFLAHISRQIPAVKLPEHYSWAWISQFAPQMSKTRLNSGGGLEIGARIFSPRDTAKVRGGYAQIAVRYGTCLVLLANCEVVRLTTHLSCLVRIFCDPRLALYG